MFFFNKAHEHACLKDWVMDAAQDWWFLLNHFLDKVDNFLALTIQFQFTIKCWYFIGFLIPTKEDNLKIIKVSKVVFFLLHLFW